uniref:Uncharacterized protein n=1 Tax=Anguilla anguilla TaxID=7936 RepID=A0A0E9VLX9_ANGAN
MHTSSVFVFEILHGTFLRKAFLRKKNTTVCSKEK